MLNAHYSGKIDISDYWAVGDSRLVPVAEISSGTTSEVQPAQNIELIIIGCNHDNLETPINRINKAAITVQTKDCLSTTGYMNKFTNAYLKWSESKRKIWCNNEFVSALPSNISALIKPVTKLTNRHSKYGSTVIQDSTTENAFLLSECEVYATQQTVISDYNQLSNDGSQYEYMAIASNRIKYIESNAVKWWLRTGSASSNFTSYFLNVHADGNYSIDGVYTNLYGIAPAFCL